MNDSKTPKIVVGVGLVAVYAAGMGVLALRERHPAVVTSPPQVVSAADDPSPASATLAATDAADTASSVGTSGTDSGLPAVPAPVSTPTPASTPSPAAVAKIPQETPTDTDAGEAVAAPSNASGANDGQITADVKSKVEAVAPGGGIDVKTRDGVVELVGSVPSEDQFEKARLAARNVPDVRDVDVSELRIGN